MKAVLIVLISLVCLPLLAEEKTCAVKGMHCTGCVDNVKGKVCNPAMEVCDVEIKDAKAEMGQIHVKTKDAAAKVDMKAMTEQVKDAGYTLEKCTAGAPKPAAAKAKKAS